jgi:hypothetical protein
VSSIDRVKEGAVLKQRHEMQLKCPLTEAFAALVEVVAKGRWGGAAIDGATTPRPGCRYEQQRGKVLRRGKVLACLKPVSITVQEMLLDPPCCVQLRLHWRLEPVEHGSRVLLDARYLLNGAATLRRRHWHERISGHCARMLSALEQRVLAEET